MVLFSETWLQWELKVDHIMQLTAWQGLSLELQGNSELAAAASSELDQSWRVANALFTQISNCTTFYFGTDTGDILHLSELQCTEFVAQILEDNIF